MRNVFETLPRRIEDYHRTHKDTEVFDKTVERLQACIAEQPIEQAPQIIANALRALTERQLKRAFETGDTTYTADEIAANIGITTVAKAVVDALPMSVIGRILEQACGDKKRKPIAEIVGSYLASMGARPYDKQFNTTVQFAITFFKAEIQKDGQGNNKFRAACSKYVAERWLSRD